MNTKIFIVDDDEAVRDSLRMLLESYGLDVEDYASAREFVQGYRPGARMPDDILLATIGRAAEPPSLGPRTVRSCAD